MTVGDAALGKGVRLGVRFLRQSTTSMSEKSGTDARNPSKNRHFAVVRLPPDPNGVQGVVSILLEIRKGARRGASGKHPAGRETVGQDQKTRCGATGVR